MRYWVYFKDSDKVSEVPYEPKDLYMLPGFNHETLIQPEIIAEGAAQEWLAAYNFTDVQEAAEQAAAAAAQPPVEDLPAEPEVYEEFPAAGPAPIQAAPAAAVPVQAVPVQAAPAQSGPSDLEKMLMDKLEQLNRELAQLKQQQMAPAPVPAPAPAALAPEPEPQSQPGQPVEEDTETIQAPPIVMDNFLGDVIKDEFSGNRKKAVEVKAEPQPPAELNLVDLKSKSPAPVESVIETQLPPSQELQAEELQAEPFAGEPISAAPQQEQEPAAPAEQTAPIISAPNTAEDSVLDEFAQDKNNTNTAPRQVQTEEGPITTLDELTGRSPLHHSDGAPRPAEDDKFLKTFTTGIEEVFMDQPTSVISDYVPPADAGNFSQRNLLGGASAPVVVENLAGVAADNFAGDPPDPPDAADKHEGPEGRVQNPQPTVKSVRRIKPIAIKTVPMVSSDGQDIQYEGEAQLEEVVIESGSSPVFKLIKIFSALASALVILFMFLALLAWMSIIPKSISPAHGILGKIFKDKTEAAAPAAAADPDEQMPPDDGRAAAEAEEAGQQVIANVKNYLLLDGLTLGEKIDLLHQDQAAQIQWTADPAIEADYYSVAVKLPPNNEGYSLTYRFSYNIVERVLAPTTSEANNLMNQRLAL